MDRIAAVHVATCVCIFALGLTSGTLAQNVTVGPTAPPAPTALSTTIDFRLGAWSDANLPVYLATLARIAGVPVQRVQPRYYGLVPALEFGNEYIFTVTITGPTNRGTDTRDAVAVAQQLAADVTAMLDTDRQLRERNFLSAATVVPEKRATERGSRTVNYVWVAFLLIGFAMVVVSGIVLMRRRSRSEEEVTHDEDETIRAPPSDLNNENVTSVLKLVEKAEKSRQEKRHQELVAKQYEPKACLFRDALEHDHRLRLPPPTDRYVADPLAPNFGMQPSIDISAPPAVRSSSAGVFTEASQDPSRLTVGSAAEPTGWGSPEHSLPSTARATPAYSVARGTPGGATAADGRTSRGTTSSMREVANELRMLEDADL